MKFKSKSQELNVLFWDAKEQTLEELKKLLNPNNFRYYVWSLNKDLTIYDRFTDCRTWTNIYLGEYFIVNSDGASIEKIAKDELFKYYKEITEDIPPKEYELTGYLSDTNEFISAMFYNEVTEPLNSQWMHYKDYYNTPVYKQKG